MRPSILAVLSGLLLAFSPAAQAQYIDMPALIMHHEIMNNLGIMAVGQSIVNSRIKANLQGQPDPAPSPKIVYPKQLSFNRSPNSTLAQMMAGTGPDAKEKATKVDAMVAEMWRMYASTMSKEVRDYGFPLNDVASALAYFVEINYMFANNLNFLETPTSIAVYKQVSKVFLDNPQFAKFSDGEKQAIAEVFVTAGGIPRLMFRDAKPREEVKKAASRNLEALFGANAGKLLITAKGLEF